MTDCRNYAYLSNQYRVAVKLSDSNDLPMTAKQMTFPMTAKPISLSMTAKPNDLSNDSEAMTAKPNDLSNDA